MPYALRVFISLATTFLFSHAAVAEPTVPDNDDVLVEQAAPIGAVHSNSENVEDSARELIRKARLQSEPRLYSRAEALIEPALSEASDPELLILRASIRQARHDFAGAVKDLTRVIETNPRNRQALISRAFIRMTQGSYGPALNDCQALPASTGQLVRTACFARLLGLTGKASMGYRLLSGALGQMPQADAQLQAWVHVILADMAMRIDKPDLVHVHFDQAIELSANARSIRATYADYLVGADEADLALDILSLNDQSDAALLTRARAGRALQTDVSREIAQLQERFETARRQGGALHLREEARFLLDVVGNPSGALKLAKANFATQREPEDILLLIAAAAANGNLSQAKAALDHRRTFGTEDRRVDVVLEMEADG